MHRSRAHEWLGDFIGERRFPAQRHRPKQPQLGVLDRQPARQCGHRPGLKTIRQRRTRGTIRPLRELPVAGFRDDELPVNPLPRQMPAVIEQALRHRSARHPQHAVQHHRTSGEKLRAQHARRVDEHRPERRLAVGAVLQFGCLEDGERADRFIVAPPHDALARGLGQRAVQRDQLVATVVEHAQVGGEMTAVCSSRLVQPQNTRNGQSSQGRNLSTRRHVHPSASVRSNSAPSETGYGCQNASTSPAL